MSNQDIKEKCVDLMSKVNYKKSYLDFNKDGLAVLELFNWALDNPKECAKMMEYISQQTYNA